MKIAPIKSVWMAVGLVMSVALSSSASADTFDYKQIENVLMDDRACTFFTLVGVTMADPNLPSAGPWFAIPKSSSNYAELNAMVLSSKMAARLITVTTNGTSVCGGFAQAFQIIVR